MPRITRLAVQNYQSLGDVDIELGDLTVIVGRGDLGKSALLRALSAFVFNETGTDFIRKGEKECRVKVEIEDGKTAEWIKDEKTARYEYDGRIFTKLAGGVPAEITDLLGIHSIPVDNTFSFCPQIHTQDDQPILLMETSGKAARALAKLTKLSMVLSAQQSAARDRRRMQQDITLHTREIEELTARIDAFPDMEGFDTLLTEARESIVEANSRLTRVWAAYDALDQIEAANHRLEVKLPTVKQVASVLERIDLMQNRFMALSIVERANAGVEMTQGAVSDAEFDLRERQRELDDFLAELKVCPVCGQPMGEEHHD